MKKILRKAIDLLEAGENMVCAVVLDQAGSAPRHGGSVMLVRENGNIAAGSVGGGKLEHEVALQAQQLFAKGGADMLRYDLSAESVASLGMVCGGKVSVLILLIEANNIWREFFAQATRMASSGRQGWLGFDADAARIGFSSMWLADSEGAFVAGVPLLPPVDKKPQALQELGSYAFDEATGNAVFSFITGGTAFVFGGGHVGQKTAHLLDFVGFASNVLDDRQEFIEAQLYPEGMNTILLSGYSPEEIPCYIDMNSYIVIVTRGHLHDREVLAWALRTNARYIGMIGSRTKREATYAALLSSGFTQTDIDRVKSPIGMTIGAETPEEIAVSIVGEMIACRAGKL